MSSTVTPRAPVGEQDWTTTAMDRIDSAVGLVRENATNRLVVAARAVVFGLIAAVLGIAILLVLVVSLLRLLDVYVGNLQFAGLDTHPGRSVWVVDVIFGGIFALVGLFLLRKASAHNQE